MTPQPQHPLNCDNCTNDDCEFHDKPTTKCNFAKPFFAKKGCASHSSRRDPSAEPKFNSTDLLLLANDEWKRREERKHNHEQIPWCVGFINGFLTDKKWARDWLDKIQNDAEEKLRSKAGAP